MPTPRAKRRLSTEEGIVPIVFGCYLVAYLLQVYGLPPESTRYPYLLILCITGLFVWVIFKKVYVPHLVAEKNTVDQPCNAIRRIGVRERKTPVRWMVDTISKYYKPIALMIMTFIMPSLMDYFGFTIATSLFLAILFWIYGNRRFSTIGVLSVGCALLFFVLLHLYLRIPLPPFAWAELPLGL
jgi:hypothetical protein